VVGFNVLSNDIKYSGIQTRFSGIQMRYSGCRLLINPLFCTYLNINWL